jgi:hypothetical protein
VEGDAGASPLEAELAPDRSDPLGFARLIDVLAEYAVVPADWPETELSERFGVTER